MSHVNWASKKQVNVNVITWNEWILTFSDSFTSQFQMLTTVLSFTHEGKLILCGELDIF